MTTTDRPRAFHSDNLEPVTKAEADAVRPRPDVTPRARARVSFQPDRSIIMPAEPLPHIGHLIEVGEAFHEITGMTWHPGTHDDIIVDISTRPVTPIRRTP